MSTQFVTTSQLRQKYASPNLIAEAVSFDGFILPPLCALMRSMRCRAWCLFFYIKGKRCAKLVTYEF
jgi:hypothetical protein